MIEVILAAALLLPTDDQLHAAYCVGVHNGHLARGANEDIARQRVRLLAYLDFVSHFQLDAAARQRLEAETAAGKLDEAALAEAEAGCPTADLTCADQAKAQHPRTGTCFTMEWARRSIPLSTTPVLPPPHSP